MQWKIARLVLTLGSAALVAASCLAQAQNAYPVKPITMYVGFAAGSATDIIARVITQKLSQRLGQPIIVQNLAGAGSAIATATVARSAPDGYTLLTASGALTILPAINKSLKFDIENDLTPIGLIGHSPALLLVNDKLPVRTFGEFVAYAKKHPDQLNYGSSGIGGVSHMAMELLKAEAGIQVKHVPYRGNSAADAALISGEIQAVMDPVLLALQPVASKRVRALAVTGEVRSTFFPDVPTFAEAGMPNFNPWVYFGVLGPAKLPKDVLDRLNKELNEVLDDPGVRSTLSQSGGLVIEGSTPDQMARRLHDDMVKWKRVAENGNISAE
jgi:tripartite-type tricarboxylate transporter receptor subunit TctC